MLGRFVVPVRRLPDLAPYRSFFREADAPYHFSVLGTGGDTGDAFLEGFAADLEAISTFEERYGGRAYADVMEVRLPASGIGASSDALLGFLDDVHRHLVRSGTAQLDLFLEVPLNDSGREALPAYAAAVAEHNSRQAVPARCPVSLKMRCGGAQPADVPSVNAVADFIAACSTARVRFKATAGLHHPLRHHNEDRGTPMHGFLNVFAAAVLAYEHDLDATAVGAILDEEHPDNFQFGKEGLSWRTYTAPLNTIDHVRETLALSFGSCSFEEPVDDLRDLELL